MIALKIIIEDWQRIMRVIIL